MYLKGHLVMAMGLWPEATIRDCQKVNHEYMKVLPKTQAIRSGMVKMSDIRLACEYHPTNPVVKGTKT